jgi:hypothetical protein
VSNVTWARARARRRCAEALGGEDSGSSPQGAMPHGDGLWEDRALAPGRQGTRREGIERGRSAVGVSGRAHCLGDGRRATGHRNAWPGAASVGMVRGAAASITTATCSPSTRSQ